MNYNQYFLYGVKLIYWEFDEKRYKYIIDKYLDTGLEKEVCSYNGLTVIIDKEHVFIGEVLFRGDINKPLKGPIDCFESGPDDKNMKIHIGQKILTLFKIGIRPERIKFWFFTHYH